MTSCHSYLHLHPGQVSGSKESRKWNYLLVKANIKKKVDKRYCRQWHGRFMRTSSVRETKTCAHTLTFIVCSLSVWGHTLSCLVVQVISVVSAGLCCGVFGPSVCLTWSVSEKLQSPGKFCRPPIIIAAHKEPNPVLLIILSSLSLFGMVHARSGWI